MAERTKARVKPELLVWARESAFLGLADAAQKLNIKEDQLSSWENGEGAPTINQLRSLGRVYKRPISVFYLARPPKDFMAINDFRRLPGDRLNQFSPRLALEIRYAHQRRQLAIDLHQEANIRPKKFSLEASLKSDVEELGAVVRESLSITYHDQVKWRDQSGRTAFNAWRSAIEQLGVLVFQVATVPSDEASGFAIAESVLPVIVVNRKDPFTRRTFSLMHEFVHIMLKASGVSDLNVEGDPSRRPEDQRVEVFCNKVAAAILIPRDRLLSEELVLGHGRGPTLWTDQEISALAKIYSVSREAILRRLLTFGRTTETFYRQKRAQYLAEVRGKKLEQPEEEVEFKRNMANEVLGIFGRPLVKMVLSNYYQDRMSLSEVSGYLGVKTRHLAKIEQMLGFRA